MRVLHFSAMWPTKLQPSSGTFVKSLVEGLRNENGVHDVLVVPVEKTRWNYIGIAPQLLRRLREGRYDLVHAQYAHCALIAGLVAPVPVVAHYHGEFGDSNDTISAPNLSVVTNRLDRRKDACLARISSRLAKGAIVVKQSDLVSVSSRYKAVIPIGPDESKFVPIPHDEACARLGWDSKSLRVLFPSNRQRVEKNYPLFQRVINLLELRGLKVEPVILEGVPHENVPLYLNAVDLMLLTSRTEASATVIKEANLCNLPVVACPAGDAALQLSGVRPGGVFFPEPEMLADAAKTILLSRTQSDGRKKAEKWGLKQTVRSVMKFYQLVLSGS